jgi:thioredoxin reductase
MIRDDDFRRDQLAQDGLLKKYEIELKYNAQISNAEIQAVTSMNREATINQPGMA